MAERMFKGFGFEDPFKDDPFFNRSGFGDINQMMSQAHNMMRMEGGTGNRFQVMQYSNSTKIGPDGRPVKEVYQTQAKGAIGPDGKRITERQ